MIYIENQYLKVGVRPYGATLSGFYDKTAGEELLWQGEERSWTEQDVVIFPLIARLQDKYYTVDGTRYQMDIHGLACYNNFEIYDKREDFVTLLLTSSADTLKNYPFEFKLFVKRVLEGKRLVTFFTVENIGDCNMLFNIGAHPAFKIDGAPLLGGIDTGGNYIVFDGEQRLQTYKLNAANQFITGLSAPQSYTRIELNKGLVKNDAVIFKDVKGAVVLERKNGRKLRFELSEPPVLAFWSHAVYGGYICIEPWLGLPDTDPPTRELKDKPYIINLPPRQTYTYTFTVELAD